jgi:hypothetical protein
MIFTRRLPLLFAVLGCLAPAIAAGPGPNQDLGEGLAYFRVHSLADDAKALETAVAADTALVIDVRFAAVRAGDAPLFEQALAKHHGPALLCVLVSPSTAPELSGPLAAVPGRVATLGIAGSVPAAKVIVDQPAETDRRAYDAFESGTALAALISGKIEKDRYDEAALMNDFSNGNTSGEPPPAPDQKALKAAPEKPPALVDRVLQRAVHLYRALAAIKPRS